jgi:signal peptidase I
MVPTLQPGDRFFVDSIAYANKAPQRGDVITFVREGLGDTMWVKRVIANGGDVIEGVDEEVTLNGHVLHEPYVAPLDTSEALPPPFGPLMVPAGKLFLIGDARQNSNDSRYFGFVDSEEIRGKVLYIFGQKTPRESGNASNDAALEFPQQAVNSTVGLQKRSERIMNAT